MFAGASGLQLLQRRVALGAKGVEVLVDGALRRAVDGGWRSSSLCLL